MYKLKKNVLLRRLPAFALALCMTLSLLPALAAPALADESDAAMDQLQSWGVVGGYPDGNLHPERSLTRAEFVSMVNRAYGYTQTGPTPFIDVPASAWYADDVAIAYNAKYFTGVSPRMAAPDDSLTREQSMVLLARNMRLDPVAGEVTEFADGRDFSEWSRGYARAAAQADLIDGYDDGSFKPTQDITRGEMAVMLQRALGTLVNQEGTHTLSDVYGNVTINTPNTILKDSTIAGDLFITGGLDLGDVTLENVRVLGDIIVAGGGESQAGKDSVILRNVEADSLLVDSIADQYVSLAAEGNTVIPEATLRSDAFVQDRTRPGSGLLNISLESPDPAARFTLSGNLETVVNKTPGSALNVAMGTVDSLTMDEHATNATLNLDVNSTATTLNLDVATRVTGVGDIDRLNVNAPGSDVQMLPDTIEIRPGITAVIAGETMNAQQARESSADPRLLAGYPKIKNIAPTTATAVFAANKSGTVYWAISTTTDGSIGEEELISPTKDNRRIVLSGNLPITSSTTEFTAALTKLEPASNYYLTTVMIDARNRHSPVKVAAFSTPDNTVPAFTTGHPRIVKNDFTLSVGKKTDSDGNSVQAWIPNFYVQAGVMANKSCQLYYALYPAGSAAPTGQMFRTGALGKPLLNGVDEILRNELWTKDFSGLAELTTYDLYFWLTDSDGANSSTVQKLTFTTKDGTPPEFQHETPLVSGNPPATSIPTNANLSENAAVFWAVVKHGDNFINTKETTSADKRLQTIIDELTAAAFTDTAKKKELDILKRKIESGTGSLRSGSANAQKDRDAAVNVTGLTSESAYDVYFVAKDPAGNYSDIKVLENIHTLDTTPPTVTQEFSRTNEKGEPYANTDIELIFSEDVQHYPTTFMRDSEGKQVLTSDGSTVPETLLSLRDSPEALGAFLASIIELYNESGLDPSAPLDPFTGTEEEKETADWTIDFRKAVITQDPDNGAVTVRLGSAAGALKLRSGATYHFTCKDVQDLATTPNRMANMPVSLPSFRTIAAQVQLRKDVSASKLTYGGKELEIDMAFSVRPISVNVDDNVLWDMLYWSDSTARFDVYRRVRGTESWEKVAPLDGEDYSAITISGTDTYIGKGLYAHLSMKSQPPVNVTGDGRDNLDPEKVYEYAVHFTKVGDIEEGVNNSGRNTWNKEISFRINVITAETPTAFDRLNSYSGGINYGDYAWMRSTQNVLEVNTTDANSEYFTLYKSFSDRSAPTFTQGYPTFTAQDIGADIRVMTDRAGTIYWVVAPMTSEDALSVYSPDIPPTATVPGVFGAENNAVDGVNRFSAYFAPTEGAKEFIPHKGSDVGAPFELERPTISAIYNPNFGSDRVRSGSIRATGSGVQTIRVTDLEPSTSYYVYFVTQSDGQAIYSDHTMLYQFWTEAVNRPKLYIDTNGSSTAKVRSRNMDATANYAIFLSTALPSYTNVPPDRIDFEEQFGTAAVLGAKNLAAFEEAYPVGHKYRSSDFTVRDALTEQFNDGGTLYDKYASVEHKDELLQLITGQTHTRGHIDGSANVSLAQDVADVVNCEEQYSIEPNRQYLFIAAARSLLAREGTDADSYGFCAYEPIFIVDSTPPSIATIDGYAYVNTTNTDQAMGDYRGGEGGKPKVAAGTMSGQINLNFDKDIYYYVNDSTNLPFTTSTTDTAASVGYPKFQAESNKAALGTRFSTISARATGSTNVNGVTLEFMSVPTGTEFIVTANLVSYYSKLDLKRQLRLKLRYDADSGKVFVDLTPDSWYDTESVELTVLETAIPAPESITLNPSAVTLNLGESKDISVQFSPYGSSARILWTFVDRLPSMSLSDPAGDATVVSLDPAAAGGPSATVTGTKVGTAYIRVTAEGVADAQYLTVIVKADPSIELDKHVLSLTVGDTTQLTATVLNPPSGHSVVWECSDRSNLWLGTDGKLQAIAPADRITVTATIYDRSGKSIGVSDSCVVQIIAAPSP